MQTYQDLVEVVNNEKQLKEFIVAAIDDYKSGDIYRWAVEGEAY